MSAVRSTSIRAALLLLALATLLLASTIGTDTAQAAESWWHLNINSRPSVLPAEAEAKGEIVFTASNLGDETADGETSAITIAPVLPAGLKLRSVDGIAGESGHLGGVVCSKTPLVCTFKGKLPPYDAIEVRATVEVLEGAESGEDAQVEVFGGGSLPAHASEPLAYSSGPTPFGIQNYELTPEAEGGGPVTQAGSHPFQMTTTVDVNQDAAKSGGTYEVTVPALPKDVRFRWPAGVLGNPSPVPQCSLAQFLTVIKEGAELANACPAKSAIGVAMVTIDEPKNVGMSTITVPLFNLEPAFGEPARFGFFIDASNTPIVINPSLRSGDGEDYGITLATPNITQFDSLLSVQVTTWGVPDDPAHDNSRGWSCLYATRGQSHERPCEPAGVERPPAFLLMPTSCSGSALKSSVSLDSWLAPLEQVSLAATMPTLDGCNRLSFSPTVTSTPTSDQAMTSTGLAFDMAVDDEGITSGIGLAQSQLAKAVISLPVGVTTNPSVAAGLSPCSLAEYQSETLDSAPGTGCRPESKIGEVEIESPLVSQKITGSVYLARQYENPYDSLLTLYVVAKNPEIGVMIRVAGKVDPNPVTGQLVTTFEDVPQLPFSHFHFAFRQGQRAPLATPPACGTYTTQAELTPYSDPSQALKDTATFTITSGSEGGPCPSGGTPPFEPSVTAGTVNNAGGTYSPMYMQVTRDDTEQEITRFSAQLPAGLTANLSGIPFCPEADIEGAKKVTGVAEEAEPSCPAASQIGSTKVGVGVGSALAWSSGRLYFAGPYNGAPFSVVAINSAKVGPFDLGTVVVREALSINPETGAVTIDAKASDPIPHILDGIVIHARDIRIYVDRPNFTINPTSCAPMTFAATVDGAGADPSNPADQTPVTIDDRFQAADCSSLGFTPTFTAQASGKTSKADGTSLHVGISYPKDSLGKQANIHEVRVELPRQLPVRQSTLPKACVEAQFAANPAGCPPASIVGYAKAVTPILPVPLEGPAYFVSHGGAGFPDLDFVLQGYGVTIDLRGETFIGKSNIISTTFKTVPDQPVTSFELTLPKGPYSALTNNGDLCHVTKTVAVKEKVRKKVKGHIRTSTRKVHKKVFAKLVMPTTVIAQNGAELHQNTVIAVRECGKAKPWKAGRKRGANHKQKRKHRG
jgi:hypothetical protein